MIWRKQFSFRRALELTKGITNKKDVEKTLISYYKKHLHNIGVPVKEIYPLKWDKENKTVTIEAKVGKCKHLAVTDDNKAVCLNYKNRPNECRDYLCKKIREKILLEKVKENERSAKLVKSHIWESNKQKSIVRAF